MPFYCEVRWLFRGNILSKIFKVKQQIVNFLRNKRNIVIYRILISLRMLHFLCDSMSKQNEPNSFLLGKSKFIYDIWSKIQAFRKKLEFLKNTLAKFELPEAE